MLRVTKRNHDEVENTTPQTIPKEQMKYWKSMWGATFVSRFDEMEANPKCYIGKKFQRRIGISYLVFNELIEKAENQNIMEPLPGGRINDSQKKNLKARLFDQHDSHSLSREEVSSEGRGTPGPSTGGYDSRKDRPADEDSSVDDEDLGSVNSDESIDQDGDDDDCEYLNVPLEIKLMVVVRLLCKGGSYSLLGNLTGMSRKCVRRCHEIFLSRFPNDQFLEWIKATRKLFIAPRRPRQKKVTAMDKS